MITTAIINQKGGVGKTTTSQALSEGLALRGYRVLLIDLDPQGNLSKAYKKAQGIGSLSLFKDNRALRGELIQIDERLSLLPSSPHLSELDSTIKGKGREYLLKSALAPLGGEYDYCIIDTAPSLGIATVNALTASEGVVITTLCEYFSLEGIQQLSDTIDVIRKYSNPSLVIRGLLLTRYNNRSIIKREIEEQLKAKAETLGTVVYNSHIRESIAVIEAQTVGKGLYNYSMRSNASKDYLSFTDEFIEQDKEKFIL